MMTTTAMRKKLINYTADADEKKVKGLYMLVEDDMAKNEDVKCSDVQLEIVEEEREKYLKGQGESYSWESSKKSSELNTKKHKCTLFSFRSIPYQKKSQREIQITL